MVDHHTQITMYELLEEYTMVTFIDNMAVVATICNGALKDPDLSALH